MTPSTGCLHDSATPERPDSRTDVRDAAPRDAQPCIQPPATACSCVTGSSHHERDVSCDRSVPPAAAGPTAVQDRVGVGSTKSSVPDSELAVDVRPGLSRTPTPQELDAMLDVREGSAGLRCEGAIWMGLGPLSPEITGLVLKTKSGLLLRILNPDADLDGDTCCWAD